MCCVLPAFLVPLALGAEWFEWSWWYLLACLLVYLLACCAATVANYADDS